ncbi:ABC transporter permease [Halalkalibacter krulwichiae]|nr:ABC transporter permease [Halalkalibacter krulwichiae]
MKSIVWLGYELKNMLTDRKVVGVLIFGPLFLLAFFSYVVSPFFSEEDSMEKINIALVNLDDARETRIMLQQFIQNPDIQEVVTLRQVNEVMANQWLASNQVAAVITIPEGFGRDLARGINTPIVVTGNEQRPQQSALVRQLMQSGANMVTASQSGINTIYLYMEEAKVAPEELNQIFHESILSFTLLALNRQEIWKKERISAFGDLSMGQYYLVNAGILFVFFIGLFGLKVGTNESRLLERRLRSLGINHWQIVMVRVGSLALFIVVPYVLFFGPSIWIMKESFQGSIWEVIIISALVIITISSFFIFFSLLFDNIAAINLASLILLIAMSLSGGTIIPLAYLPTWLEYIQPFSMMHWLSQGWFSAFFHESGNVFWLSCMVLVLFILISLSLAVIVQSSRREV